jgi:hypothetical protein
MDMHIGSDYESGLELLKVGMKKKTLLLHCRAIGKEIPHPDCQYGLVIHQRWNSDL